MDALIEKLTGLEPYLLSKIKGQDHAISRVCSVLVVGRFDEKISSNRFVQIPSGRLADS